MPTTNSFLTVVPPTVAGYPEPVPVRVEIHDESGYLVNAYTTRNGSVLHPDFPAIRETTTFHFVGSPGPLRVRCSTTDLQVLADLTIKKVKNSMVECRPPAGYPTDSAPRVWID